MLRVIRLPAFIETLEMRLDKSIINIMLAIFVGKCRFVNTPVAARLHSLPFSSPSSPCTCYSKLC